MKKSDNNNVKVVATDKTAQEPTPYRRPEVYVLGAAVELVQGYNGYYYDGIRAYKTDRRN
jgi:hypothetical protein